MTTPSDPRPIKRCEDCIWCSTIRYPWCAHPDSGDTDIEVCRLVKTACGPTGKLWHHRDAPFEDAQIFLEPTSESTMNVPDEKPKTDYAPVICVIVTLIGVFTAGFFIGRETMWRKVQDEAISRGIIETLDKPNGGYEWRFRTWPSEYYTNNAEKDGYKN